MLCSPLNLLASALPLETTSLFIVEVGEAGGAGVKRPADERAISKSRRSEGTNSVQIKLNDIVPLIKSDLTIEDVAERLGISVEAASMLVLACLRSSSRNEA
jgi:hypothetical protein